MRSGIWDGIMGLLGGRDSGCGGRDRGRAKSASPLGVRALAEGRVLDVPTGCNVRELGGYPTPYGTTLYHRFLRSGDNDGLSREDIASLRAYGVSADIDLRSVWEVGHAPDPLGRERGVRYLHAPLHSHDMHDRDLGLPNDTESYMANGYLAMLGNRKVVRDVFAFMSRAGDDDCVLFHCAAGMDRTGITSMLVLGLCDAGLDDILRDYLLSFADARRVEELVCDGGPDVADADEDGIYGVPLLRRTMELVYKTLAKRCGGVRGYLLSCGLTDVQLDAVCRHLVG